MIRHEVVPPVQHAGRPQIELQLGDFNPYKAYKRPVHGYPVVESPTIESQQESARAYVTQETTFLNYTHVPITIRMRSGLAMSVPSTPSSMSDFVIRKVMKFKEATFASIVTALKAIRHIEDAELHEIKQRLSHVRKDSFESVNLLVDYRFRFADIQDKAGTVYHHESDCVISLKSVTDVEQHPCSAQFLNIGAFGNENRYRDQPEFNLKVRYVNHDPNAGVKYMHVLGRVYRLIPQRDAPARIIVFGGGDKKPTTRHYTDYIQLFYSARHDPTIEGGSGVKDLKMSLAEAQAAWGVYDSYEEALAQGMADANRKRELLEMQHDLEKVKISLEKTKQENAIEQANNARERQRLEQEFAERQAELKRRQQEYEERMHQLDIQRRALEIVRKDQEDLLKREYEIHKHRIEMERDQLDHDLKRQQAEQKDRLEERSARRKDWSEIIKFIPAAVMAIGASYVAYQKVRAPKATS